MHGSIITLTLLICLVPTVALVGYLWAGWRARRDEVLLSLPVRAIDLYLSMYRRADSVPRGHDSQSHFRALYHRDYGRRHYIAPSLAFFGTLVVAMYWGIESALGLLGEAQSGSSRLSPVGIAGIAGAYTWVTFDFIARSRRRDLAPSDIAYAALRLVIALPLCFAVGAMVNPELGAPLAFFLGSFPTHSLMAFMRTTARKRLPELGDEEESSELLALQSMTKSNARRLADEGITTNLQLAYCDPIDLTIRANFSFNYVIDLMSQALAWTYLEQRTKDLRFALRGAVEILVLVSELDVSGDDDKSRRLQKVADESLTLLADKLKIERVLLERALREISEDPYARFTYYTWFRESTDGFPNVSEDTVAR